MTPELAVAPMAGSSTLSPIEGTTQSQLLGYVFELQGNIPYFELGFLNNMKAFYEIRRVGGPLLSSRHSVLICRWEKASS